ncbi:MAG: DMT family transporter [Crocinitomicaceae bacterium]|jgi:drug/metabolite transporter (DMT)-like permease|nr:DMT family transporter [Crocinitomicaceae bacterium]MDG1736014.1 DMT family transporter [Crocinitomicaceae bacterium]MDG2506594.1 DMT family transporter [Crocinitomicaceae bacterium]
MKKGILFVILSGVCFLFVNFLVKIFGGNTIVFGHSIQKLPAHELVLARSIVSFVISSFVIFRKKLPYFGVNKKWLVIRGTAGTIALTLFFMTIQNLPFAIAAIIQYLAPLFTMLFTFILLGEKIFRVQWLFVLLAFSGVCLISLQNYISADSGLVFQPLWVGLGMLSASISGVAYTAIVKLKETDEPISIVLYFPMISIPIMLVLCMFDFVMPHGVEWLLLLLVGVFTQFAQVLLTKALHMGTSSVIIPFQYLGIIYAILVGYLIFDERLNTFVNIGVLMILSGILMNAYFRFKKTEKKFKNP